MVLPKIILPILIFIGGFVGPLFCVVLQIIRPISYGWLFAAFISSHGLFRLWESFFTSKDKNCFIIESDWTLTLTTVAYTGFCYMVIFDFFFLANWQNIYISVAGLVLYAFAYYLRWWGMRALGSQWSIHAVGEKKVKHVRFSKVGPYKYIRHPIYASILIDQIAVLLIANTFYAFIYYILISVPAYWLRMRFEERNNIQKFGSAYREYMNSVGMILPKVRRLDSGAR